MNQADRLAQIRTRLRQFRDQRDWSQFHNPKDLAAAIAIEAAELQEIFLWVPPAKSEAVIGDRREAVEQEVADVMIQLLNFADAANIDLLEAVEVKIRLNETKYPVEKSRGHATKYTELE